MNSKKLVKLIEGGGYKPEFYRTHDGPDLVSVTFPIDDNLAFLQDCFSGLSAYDSAEILLHHGTDVNLETRELTLYWPNFPWPLD